MPPATLSTRLDDLLASQSHIIEELSNLYARLSKIGVVRDASILRKITKCKVVIARAKVDGTSDLLNVESELSEATRVILADIMSESALYAPKLDGSPNTHTQVSQISSSQGSPLSGKGINVHTPSTFSAASSEAGETIRSLESTSAICSA